MTTFPDPDAQMVMAVLLASPHAGEPGALIAAARAYEAIKRCRERGYLPSLDEPTREAT